MATWSALPSGCHGPSKAERALCPPTHAMPLSSLDICPTVHGGNEPPDHSPEGLSSVRADTTKEKTKWLNMNMKDSWTSTPTADSIKRRKTTREEISNIDDNVLRLLKHTQLTRAMQKSERQITAVKMPMGSSLGTNGSIHQ